MCAKVTEPDTDRKLRQLLDEHYDTLEKLYSLVLTIRYNLDRRIFTFLRPLSMAKQALMEQLSRHQSELDQWLKRLPADANLTPHVLKQIHQIQLLGNRIVQVDAQNVALAKTVGSRMLDSSEIERSHLCEWRSQI